MGAVLLTDWIQSAWFMQYAATISFCLLGTLILEVPLAMLLRVRGWENIEKVVLINILTNPALVTVLFVLEQASVRLWAICLIQFFLEIAVVIIEGMYYRKTLRGNPVGPFLLSAILNTVSYGAGLLLDFLQ